MCHTGTRRELRRLHDLRHEWIVRQLFMHKRVTVSSIPPLFALSKLCLKTRHRCVNLRNLIPWVGFKSLNLSLFQPLVLIHDVWILEKDNFRLALLHRCNATNTTAFIAWVVIYQDCIVIVRWLFGSSLRWVGVARMSSGLKLARLSFKNTTCNIICNSLHHLAVSSESFTFCTIAIGLLWLVRRWKSFGPIRWINFLLWVKGRCCQHSISKRLADEQCYLFRISRHWCWLFW